MRPDATAAIQARRIAAMEQRAAGLDGQARQALEARVAELRRLAADAPAEGLTAIAAPRQSPLRELVEPLMHKTTAYPEIPALAEFRELWSTLRADSRLRQSVAHAPTDAGPLNSAALARRAIALMREASPGYLRSFLAYVDDLAWLEQLGSAAPATAPGAGARKRARRKPQA
jgi:hypothetical protein